MTLKRTELAFQSLNPMLRLGIFIKNKKELFKKILLIAITFLGYLLASLIFVHSLSRLLNEQGAGVLPVMMIIVYSVTSLFLLISTAISTRLPVTKFFSLSLITFGILFMGLYFMNRSEFTTVAYFLISNIFLAVLNVSLLKFILALITPLQGKSLLPIIYGFNSLGFMLGCYWADKFQVFHEQVGIGLIPALAMAVILLLVLAIHALFRRQILERFREIKKEPILKNLNRSFRFTFRESRLFRYVAAAVFLLIGIQLFSEFKLNTVMSQGYSGDELTTALGFVYGMESALTIIMSLFVVKTVLLRFGVMTTLLLFPVITFLSLSVAVAANLVPNFAIIYYLSFSIPYYSLVISGISQIFLVVPRQLSESVYFFIKGVLEAVFAVIFSVLLIANTYDITLERKMNTPLLFFFIVGLFFVLLKIRKIYSAELKDNLFKNDLFLKQQSIDLLAEKNQRGKGEEYLRRMLLLKNLDEDTTEKVMNAIGIIGNQESLVDLCSVVRRGTPKSRFAAVQAISMIMKRKEKMREYPLAKHILLNTYKDILISNVPRYVKMEIISSLKYFELEDVFQFLEESLKSSDMAIKVNAIETIGHFKERATIVYMEPFLDDPNVEVSCAAIMGLWKFRDLRLRLTTRIAKLLDTTDEREIFGLLDIIGAIKATWEKEYVLKKLTHSSEKIRIHALLTLIQIGDIARIDELTNEMLKFAREGRDAEVDIILSHYREFDYETKISILQKMQQYGNEDVQYFYKAFKNSKYLFEFELNQLS